MCKHPIISTPLPVRSAVFWVTIASSLLAVAGCNGAADSSMGALTNNGGAVPTQILASDGKTGPLPGRHFTTDALVYDGVATAYNDDDSIASILQNAGKTYKRVSSAELNAMTLDELATYGTIVWPGGYASEMSNSLDDGTKIRIRDAVIERGVSYVGICAGAWMAVGPTPTAGKASSWGIAILPGPVMEEYMPSGVDGIEMTPITVAGESTTRDIVWYGGPALPEVPGGVIARYKNGTPAMTQTWAGHGLVILTSPHPEAPQIWRDQHGLSDSDGVDFDLATRLFKGALDQKALQVL